jgi:multidrug resistance efflux pump
VYRQALVGRLAGQIAASKMSLEAELAQREQARREYSRKAQLEQSGFAAKAEVDRVRYEFERRDYQVQAQAGQLAAVQAQIDAALHGVNTDPGANDVAYSMQRADELCIRLAELGRTLDNIKTEVGVVRSRLRIEEQRIALLRLATISAPSDGMLWKIGTSSGERLGTGDMTAELVDCGAAFLLATIPQNVYSHINLGGEARFRLSGESGERTGKILSVTGDTSLVGDRNLAAVPVDQHKPTAIVRIAVPATRNLAAECLVGRSARVLLPVADDTVLDAAGRLLHRFF